jgi:hypothetical protein
MQVYLIETANWGATTTIAASRPAAGRWLSAAGFTHRQPEQDLDPEVECWWRGEELRRVIPVEVLE